MMDAVSKHFEHYPSRLAVAELMLKHGISVKNDDAYIGDVKQSDSSIARAANVDRRVVRSTIEDISTDPVLSALFSKLDSMVVLADAASLLGCSAIEVVPDDARRPGVMAGIMNVLSRAGINIRQAVVTGEENEVSHLIITVDGDIPGYVMTEIRGSPGVASVIIR
ncbi:putative regulator of amino acid metabolism, contains ACT domain [Thermoplasmatales archaeon BRNA1]|nr:putative regulator of amino acid metabolism, contains ACT domain [Thermoplasmatales archaeon BRNA1]